MKIEKSVLEKDIKVFYVTAKSFPFGVLEAHQKLHSMIFENKDRMYFGISAPNNKGEIIYKAAAEEISENEGEKLGCESFTIKKGDYLSIIIKNYKKDLESIGRAFEKILAEPNIDPTGYCLEIYLNNDDMKCLVKVLA